MRSTTETNEELKKHLNEGVKALRTLRDEIRVEIHLAGMDVKERWQKLEPRFDEVEKLAHDVSDASKEALNDTLTAFKGFRTSFTGKSKPEARHS
jgi:arabinogalactan endo-1,4-beta-galactosidase